MEKKHGEQNTLKSLNQKENQETLEISSTGYGLEAVQKTDEYEKRLHEQENF